ncbi:MAG: hypothetical protein GXO14_06105 [Thermococci archaeon]|nr:hypothetical protein [Thermococci archaeon]
MKLIEKAEALVEKGDRYAAENMASAALTAYRNAVYAAGAVFAYEETGMLMHDEELRSFLESKFPEVYDVIARCELTEDPDSIRGMALRLIGMAKRYVGDGG